MYGVQLRVCGTLEVYFEDKALSWTEVYYSVLNNCDLIKMTRDDHEEDNGEIIGEDTELLPTASLEGLDFDRLNIFCKSKISSFTLAQASCGEDRGVWSLPEEALPPRLSSCCTHCRDHHGQV